MKRRLNTGKSAENRVSQLAGIFERMGRGRIEKVDPPTKVIRKGNRYQIIYLRNPFLDHIGSFRGRPITFEVKDIDENTLSIQVPDREIINGKQVGGGAGLTVRQGREMRRWKDAAYITGLIWFRKNEPRLYGGSEVIAALDAGAKSLPWDGAHKVENFGEIFNQLTRLES